MVYSSYSTECEIEKCGKYSYNPNVAYSTHTPVLFPLLHTLANVCPNVAQNKTSLSRISMVASLNSSRVLHCLPNEKPSYQNSQLSSVNIVLSQFVEQKLPCGILRKYLRMPALKFNLTIVSKKYSSIICMYVREVW